MILGCFKFWYVLTYVHIAQLMGNMIKHSGPIHRCDDGHGDWPYMSKSHVCFAVSPAPWIVKHAKTVKNVQNSWNRSESLGEIPLFLMVEPCWTPYPSWISLGAWDGPGRLFGHWAPGREIPSCRRPLPASLPGPGVIAWWRWCRPLPGDGHGWGLRENLQESPIFNGKIYGFL